MNKINLVLVSILISITLFSCKKIEKTDSSNINSAPNIYNAQLNESNTLPNSENYIIGSKTNFNKDGSLLAAINDNDIIIFTTQNTKQNIQRKINVDYKPLSICFLNNNNIAIAGKSIIKIISPDKEKVVSEITSSNIVGDKIRCNDSLIATTGRKNTILIINTVSGKKIKTFSYCCGEIYDFQFNNDASKIACAINELESGNNNLVVSDLQSNSEYITNTDFEILKISFIGDSKIVTSHPGELYIWSINKGEYDDFVTGGFTLINSMDYKNDKIAVTTSGHDIIWVYSINEMKIVKQVKSNILLSNVIVRFINDNELIYTARSGKKQYIDRIKLQ